MREGFFYFLSPEVFIFHRTPLPVRTGILTILQDTFRNGTISANEQHSEKPVMRYRCQWQNPDEDFGRFGKSAVK